MLQVLCYPPTPAFYLPLPPGTTRPPAFYQKITGVDPKFLGLCHLLARFSHVPFDVALLWVVCCRDWPCLSAKIHKNVQEKVRRGWDRVQGCAWLPELKDDEMTCIKKNTSTIVMSCGCSRRSMSDSRTPERCEGEHEDQEFAVCSRSWPCGLGLADVGLP